MLDWRPAGIRAASSLVLFEEERKVIYSAPIGKRPSKNGQKMAREKLLAGSIYCAWLISIFMGSAEAIPQFNSGGGRSTLSNLLHSWKPYTVEEEIKIAGYLRRKTQSYLQLVEGLGPWSFENRPDIDEESAVLLDLKINDLKVSLKEMIATLKLIERLSKQRPGDYAKSAPLLWLTVVKDISTEKGNARDLDRVGLVKSNWANIVDIALPRLFSRILESRLTELLREEAKE
ncbi:hypothetical protein MYX65_11970 [Acidobacteria bacterium AH-259-L09]|nr:hypothetical protein [Acidobacteria bacterium AH-259-L09]